MTNLKNLKQENKKAMSLDQKTIYAAIKKAHETTPGLSAKSIKEHAKAQYIVWRLEDFDYSQLEVVHTYIEKKKGEAVTYYVLEDQQFTGHEIITRDDIYDICEYRTVIERVVNVDDFQGGDFDEAIDYIYENMPTEFCQLCAFAVRYKQVVDRFERNFKATVNAYTRYTSMQNKIQHRQTHLAPITKEDTAEQRYEGQDVAPLR